MTDASSLYIKRQLIEFYKFVIEKQDKTDLFVIESMSDVYLKLVYPANNSYFFEITNIRLSNDSRPKPLCNAKYRPYNGHLQTNSAVFEISNLHVAIEKWVALITEEIILDNELNKLFNSAKSNQTFLDFVELKSEDFTYEQKDSNQQIWLHLLYAFENSLLLNKEKYPLQDIIEEIHEIKNNKNPTPDQFMNFFKRRVEQIKELGKEAVKDIIIDGMKEAMKYAGYLSLTKLLGFI